MAVEKLDPRNRVNDAQLAAVVSNGTLWILQASLVMEDLRRRHRPFKTRHVDGIIYADTVIALGSDRADAFLYNAGTPAAIRKQDANYRTRRRAEIRKEIQRLRRELNDLVKGED